MKASEAGKGHDRRPRLVADEVHGANHCRTFGHKWRGDWCMNCFMGRSSTAEQAALTGSVVSSNLTAPAIYIDNATGNVVDEAWWPDTTDNGHPPT